MIRAARAGRGPGSLPAAAVVTHERVVTHGELARSRPSAPPASLRPRRSSRRFALVDHDADVMVGASWRARLLSGSEACQYPPGRAATSIRDLRERFDHDGAGHSRDDLGGHRGDESSRLVSWTSATVRRTHGSTRRPAGARPHLVLTTGTTGKPRGRAPRLGAAAPGHRTDQAGSRTSGGCWPTVSTSSPACRSCCTSSPRAPPWSRPLRVDPRGPCRDARASGDSRQRDADVLALPARRASIRRRAGP